MEESVTTACRILYERLHLKSCRLPDRRIWHRNSRRYLPTSWPGSGCILCRPIPKCHFFQAFGNTSFFADFTNYGFVFGGHRPVPLPSPALRRCVSYFILRWDFLIRYSLARYPSASSCSLCLAISGSLITNGSLRGRFRWEHSGDYVSRKSRSVIRLAC